MDKTVLLLLATAALAQAQPAPYSQLDPKPYNPKTDVDMEMFVAHWRA